MNLINLCKKIKSKKSKLTITIEKPEILLAPTRASKAYPFGKVISILPPVLDLTTGEYWSDLDERNYLSSLGYKEIELKLFYYDHKLFSDYARLMYDKDIGRLMYLSSQQRQNLNFWELLEVTNIFELLPNLKEAFEIIKEEVNIE